MKESPLLGDGFWHGFFDKGIIKEFNLPAPYEKLLKCFKKRDIFIWNDMRCIIKKPIQINCGSI